MGAYCVYANASRHRMESNCQLAGCPKEETRVLIGRAAYFTGDSLYIVPVLLAVNNFRN